jgi:hypothetical protein
MIRFSSTPRRRRGLADSCCGPHRACLSIAKLWTVVWPFQIASSPQYGDGPAGGVLTELGVSGSRTVSLIIDAVCVFGSTTDRSSALSSSAPYTGPLAFTVGIALVACDLVVQIDLRVSPVPHRDHDVALLALRTRRLGRGKLACRDPICPVRVHAERTCAADLRESRAHASASLSRLDPLIPRRT